MKIGDHCLAMICGPAAAGIIPRAGVIPQPASERTISPAELYVIEKRATLLLDRDNTNAHVRSAQSSGWAQVSASDDWSTSGAIAGVSAMAEALAT